MGAFVLTVKAGPPQQMTLIEEKLLKQGFSLVSPTNEPTELASRQYTRREIHEMHESFEAPCPNVLLTWRE